MYTSCYSYHKNLHIHKLDVQTRPSFYLVSSIDWFCPNHFLSFLVGFILPLILLNQSIHSSSFLPLAPSSSCWLHPIPYTVSLWMSHHSFPFHQAQATFHHASLLSSLRFFSLVVRYIIKCDRLVLTITHHGGVCQSELWFTSFQLHLFIQLPLLADQSKPTSSCSSPSQSLSYNHPLTTNLPSCGPHLPLTPVESTMLWTPLHSLPFFFDLPFWSCGTPSLGFWLPLAYLTPSSLVSLLLLLVPSSPLVTSCPFQPTVQKHLSWRFCQQAQSHLLPSWSTLLRFLVGAKVLKVATQCRQLSLLSLLRAATQGGQLSLLSLAFPQSIHSLLLQGLHCLLALFPWVCQSWSHSQVESHHMLYAQLPQWLLTQMS